MGIRILRKLPWIVLLPACLLASTAVLADEEFSAGWGPAIGAQMPVLAAPDQTGAQHTLDSLSGDQGLLLFLSRSADW